MTDTLSTLLDGLRPYPEDGSRADGPVAVDATDRLLLDEARATITAAGPADVVTIGDRFGALTLGAIALGAQDVRVHQDAVDAEAALRANALVARRGSFTFHPLGPGLLTGARVVLLQLPKSLAELTEIAELVARHAADDVVLLAGGRVKHMTRGMNDVLGTVFGQVTASLGRQKSRLLIARGPRSEARDRPLTYPVRKEVPGVPGFDTPLTVVVHGGVFAGTGLDGGTRLLLETAGRWPSPGGMPATGDGAEHDPEHGPEHDGDARRGDEAGDGTSAGGPTAGDGSTDPQRAPDGRPVAVDLGCGSGILAVAAAARGFAVVATDHSAAAVSSALRTAAANGVGHLVTAVADDAGAALPDGSADLVLLNPPFHDRTAVRTDAAHRMFETAGRVLRPGGELWTVFNSSLRYRPALERIVGRTEQVARDPRFTVTRSVRPAGATSR